MPEPLTFALAPTAEPERVGKALDELCALLSTDTGLEVVGRCADSPDALAALLARGDAHFAHVSPTLLLMSPELAHTVPLLASVRQGQAFFHAIVFSARGSGIRATADLAGKRAAWVAPTSASGYLAPRLALSRQGLDVTRLFSAERFMGAHGAVAVAVFNGIADVGATFAHFEGGDPRAPLMHAGYHETIPDAVAEIVAVAGPIPADMIVAHPSVTMRTRIALAGALCRLPADPVGKLDLAVAIGAEDFRSVSVQALGELETLMNASADLARKV